MVTVLVSLGFIAWIWMSIPGMQAYGERAMIAWAFDRVAPAPLGRVSDHFHSRSSRSAWPPWSTLIFMALFVFTTYFATLVVFIMIALGRLGHRARRRRRVPVQASGDLREVADLQAQGARTAADDRCVHRRLPWRVFFFFTLLFDSFAAGHDAGRLAIMAGCFAAGFIFFYIMKAIRNSQGVDVDLAFKQIPIE